MINLDVTIGNKKLIIEETKNTAKERINNGNKERKICKYFLKK